MERSNDVAAYLPIFGYFANCTCAAPCTVLVKRLQFDPKASARAGWGGREGDVGEREKEREEEREREERDRGSSEPKTKPTEKRTGERESVCM
jgi:hypothetical protein